jgi:hypothetical protein
LPQCRVSLGLAAAQINVPIFCHVACAKINSCKAPNRNALPYSACFFQHRCRCTERRSRSHDIIHQDESAPRHAARRSLVSLPQSTLAPCPASSRQTRRMLPPPNGPPRHRHAPNLRHPPGDPIRLVVPALPVPPPVQRDWNQNHIRTERPWIALCHPAPSRLSPASFSPVLQAVQPPPQRRAIRHPKPRTRPWHLHPGANQCRPSRPPNIRPLHGTQQTMSLHQPTKLTFATNPAIPRQHPPHFPIRKHGAKHGQGSRTSALEFVVAGLYFVDANRRDDEVWQTRTR